MKPGLGRLVKALLIFGPLLNIHHLLAALPSLIQLLLIISCTIYLIKLMLTFPRWSDELKHVGKFVRAVALLLVVVIIENFCTWWAPYSPSTHPLHSHVLMPTTIAWRARSRPCEHSHNCRSPSPAGPHLPATCTSITTPLYRTTSRSPRYGPSAPSLRCAP